MCKKELTFVWFYHDAHKSRLRGYPKRPEYICAVSDSSCKYIQDIIDKDPPELKITDRADSTCDGSVPAHINQNKDVNVEQQQQQ
jgi:hypothetical protein